MPMPPYPISCYTSDCGRLAQYKIAARWSDGVTQELKTYALTCPECLAAWFRQSRTKQAARRRAFTFWSAATATSNCRGR
jgi:hypothetical protein